MEFIQYWPQLIIIFSSILGLSYDVYRSGTTTKYPKFTIYTVIALAIQIICLYFGGFIKISFPTLIFFLLIGSGIAIRIKKQGENQDHNIFSSLLASIFIHLLFYWGGFYDVWIH